MSDEPIACRENQRGGCRRVAVAQLRLACVHEHIYTTVACSDHSARIKSGAYTRCYLCAHSAEAHDCRMRILPNPKGVKA